MDDSVFIFLQLRVNGEQLARSKIREFAGIGSLLADFLRKTVDDGVEVPSGESPILDYVDANTDESLISFRVDLDLNAQVIEGRIPPAYQKRMLDPNATVVSVGRFAERVTEGMPPEQRVGLTERLARSQIQLLDQIRETIDEEGRFLIHVPLKNR